MPRGAREAVAAPKGSFEARMLAHVQANFAERFASLGEHGVRALIREGAARARACRLETEQEVCRYIELMLTFGSDFDPPGGRVAAALADPLKSDSRRLDRAFERAWRDRSLAVKKRVRLEFTSEPAALDPLPPPQVKGAALSFTWNSDIKLAWARATVSGPHWQAGMEVKDGAGSSRPAATLAGSAGRATLTLRLDVCTGVSGRLRVRGRLGALSLEGDCPASPGEHVIDITLTPLPAGLQAAQGDVVWRVKGAGLMGSVALDNPSRLEWYVLLGRPAAFFEPAGVWVEALRFLFGQVGVTGLTTPAQVVEKVARYCHGSHGVRYDTFHGAPAYGCSGTGGTFQLGAYLTAAKPVVNCYDQAGGVQSLCGALGVAANWFFLRPYGFIHTTHLVGVGACNNPFFSNNGSSPTVGVNDRNRSAFANHAFAGLTGAVLDACAGPHTGNEDRGQYVNAAIDGATTLYSLYSNFRPGTVPDIVQPDGVTKVV
jgi:hypothetical protein